MDKGGKKREERIRREVKNERRKERERGMIKEGKERKNELGGRNRMKDG